jgi:hypothetical protein
MTDDLGNRLLARFGAGGLRRTDVGDGTALPADQAALLEGVGVPRQVGPYFASQDGGPVLLGRCAEAAGVPLRGDQDPSWVRIGTDRGAEICVDGSGEVRAEYLGTGMAGAVVNETLPAFLESLVALDEALSLVGAAKDVPEGAEHLRLLLRRLANVEEGPVGHPDSWWSRVLEDVRHTAAHPSFGAFEVVDERGEPRIVTGSGALCVHPEERIWNGLAAAGTRADRVAKVHTELEPCLMPGHYCSLWMAGAFPSASFTHNFDYGSTAASREQGFVALLRHAATRD